ncbi:MAG: hypothetical protein NTW19_05575 [Planctomycetota bacterium]|nr:hypothetical protein [Planctomycetota bacterium]
MQRRVCPTILFVWALWLSAIFLPPVARADTAVGDWGHFLVGWPKVHLNNPEGKAFTIDLHVMQWAIPAWNKPEILARVSGPDGKTILEGPQKLDGNHCTLSIPAGPAGVYLLEPNVGPNGALVNHAGSALWVGSSLEQSVVWTGETKGHAIEGRRLVTHCSVPRRWWFWVPRGVRQFTAKAQRADRYMSQREDWGYSFISPRGQRMAVLWGQPLAPKPGEEYRAEMSVTVPVEPGAGGRFWSVEVRYGDSHNYSKPNLCFEGIPPYVARSPEEWFDPTTGKAPTVDPYDDEPFMQYAPEGRMGDWPGLAHFSPCPSLGDPDGAEIRDFAKLWLWNPDNKPLRYKVGTYLPRGDAKNPDTATVMLHNVKSEVTFKERVTLFHLHEPGKNLPEPMPATGKGVFVVTVSNAERWFFFTYPATPITLAGQTGDDGFTTFDFEVGTARNWWFFVPRGTKEFAVNASCEHETDVMELQVNAPDRTMAVIYDQKGEKVVKVPPGLDGKMWHLRVDIGSASRLVTEPGPETRLLGLYLKVGLKGVPGLLSPTWEQWFDPNDPRPAMGRARAE